MHIKLFWKTIQNIFYEKFSKNGDVYLCIYLCFIVAFFQENVKQNNSLLKKNPF